MKCKLIDLPRISDVRGNLSFIEENKHVPFDIARAYWIYDVPGGESRGEHAHKEQQELIIAVSGSFSVTLDDGEEKQKVFLNRPYQGLLKPAQTWAQLHDFSSGAVALVLSSGAYDESDYIRDYDEFLKYIKQND